MTDHQLLTLWVGAFRYHLGRMTYAVSDFCALLIEEWDDLPKSVHDLIEKELESAFKADDLARSRGASHFELGMDCDRAEWEKVRRLWKEPKEAPPKPPEPKLNKGRVVSYSVRPPIVWEPPECIDGGKRIDPLVSLPDEILTKIPPISDEEIQTALEQGKRDRQAAERYKHNGF